MKLFGLTSNLDHMGQKLMLKPTLVTSAGDVIAQKVEIDLTAVIKITSH